MKKGVDFPNENEKNNLPRGVAAAPAFEHGVRGVRGKVVHNWEETIGYYREEGFTGCVLKPYRGASSIDVRVCENEEQLKEAIGNLPNEQVLWVNTDYIVAATEPFNVKPMDVKCFSITFFHPSDKDKVIYIKADCYEEFMKAWKGE